MSALCRSAEGRLVLFQYLCGCKGTIEHAAKSSFTANIGRLRGLEGSSPVAEPCLSTVVVFNVYDLSVKMSETGGRTLGFQDGCSQSENIQDESGLARSISNCGERETEILSFVCFTESCCAKAVLLKLLVFFSAFWFAHCTGCTSAYLPVEDDTASLFLGA